MPSILVLTRLSRADSLSRGFEPGLIRLTGTCKPVTLKDRYDICGQLIQKSYSFQLRPRFNGVLLGDSSRLPALSGVDVSGRVSCLPSDKLIIFPEHRRGGGQPEKEIESNRVAIRKAKFVIPRDPPMRQQRYAVPPSPVPVFSK